MNIGRPTKGTKREHRKKTVRLTEKAYFYLMKIKEERKDFEFSRYVSEHLVNDFEKDKTGYLKHQIIENQKKIDYFYRTNKLLVDLIREERLLEEKRGMKNEI